MKKAFFLLLIAAAGTAIFFYLRRQNKLVTNRTAESLLTGTWKLDSIDISRDSSDVLPAIIHNSNIHQYRYVFTNDSAVHTLSGDSLTKDSSRFEWNGNKLIFANDLFFGKENSLKIQALSKDSLVLQDRDSIVFFFIRTE